jgi:AcrR family transcriptional regulator
VADDEGAGTRAGKTPLPPVIWARRHARRTTTLSREAIVEAALRIADADGLSAVSIRRVAAELGARTMSLYSHIDSKDDLLDLMTEQVLEELLIKGDLPAGWREAITMIARREREISLRHPWLVELANHRSAVVIGPNGLRHLDQSVAALAPLKLKPLDAWRIIAAVDDYMLGYVTREVRERDLPRRHGVSAAELEAFAQPYLQELIDSGEFVNVTPLLTDGVPAAGDSFEYGLTLILDGIERRYA